MVILFTTVEMMDGSRREEKKKTLGFAGIFENKFGAKGSSRGSSIEHLPPINMTSE